MKFVNSGLLFISLFVFFSRNISAQNASVRDPKAKEILDAVSAKTKSYVGIKVTFVYTMENKKEKISESQEGVLLVKGKKFNLKLAEQEVISDGTTMWTFISDANEVQLSEPDNSEGVLTPANIFTIYEKGFKYQFLKEEQSKGKTLQLINLYPENANEKSYHSIQLSVDKTKKQLSSITIMGKEGNTYTYLVKEFTANPPVNDADFTFDKTKHPQMEVIDMR